MVILITGASRGIGASLAKHFSVQGHKVLMVSRNRKALLKVADACNDRAQEDRAFPIPFDLTDLTDLQAEFLQQLRAKAQRIDVLVNNAGKLIRKPFTEVDAREARELFETNVIAPAQLIRIILPLMADSGVKHVVNISSMGGFQGSSKFSGLAYYSASKAALGNLTECLAEELKEEGICLNALALGAVQTEMLGEAFPGYRAPLDPDQIAEFLSWFALNGSLYFNGKVLPVSVSTP